MNQLKLLLHSLLLLGLPPIFLCKTVKIDVHQFNSKSINVKTLMPFLFEGHQEIKLHYSINGAANFPKNEYRIFILPLYNKYHSISETARLSSLACRQLFLEAMITVVVNKTEAVISVGRFTSNYPVHLILARAPANCEMNNVDASPPMHLHATMSISLMNGASHLSADESFLPLLSQWMFVAYLILLVYSFCSLYLWLADVSTVSCHYLQWHFLRKFHIFMLALLLVVFSALTLHWHSYQQNGLGHPNLEYLAECCMSFLSYLVLFAIMCWTLEASARNHTWFATYVLLMFLHSAMNVLLYWFKNQSLHNSGLLFSHRWFCCGFGLFTSTLVLEWIGWLLEGSRLLLSIVFGLHLYRLTHRNMRSNNQRFASMLLLILLLWFASWYLTSIVGGILFELSKYKLIVFVTVICQYLAMLLLHRSLFLISTSTVDMHHTTIC